MAECNHEVIERVEHGPAAAIPHEWLCRSCKEPFLPEAVVDAYEETSEAALEMVAGTMSSVMWGIHQRAIEKYGTESGVVDMDTPADVEICLEEGHDWNDETAACNRCGAARFLGG